MPGKTPDIRRLQNRTDCLTAVGALGAVDFPGYFAIEITDLKVNTPDREIRSLEKAAECLVGLFALLREFLNSLNVGFKFHISEGRTTELCGSYKLSVQVLCENQIFSGCLFKTLRYPEFDYELSRHAQSFYFFIQQLDLP
jgi:hypothetical protein